MPTFIYCCCYQRDNRANSGNLPERNALSEIEQHWIEKFAYETMGQYLEILLNSLHQKRHVAQPLHERTHKHVTRTGHCVVLNVKRGWQLCGARAGKLECYQASFFFKCVI